MRQRAVRPRGDDRRKRDCLGAKTAHRNLEVKGDVALAAARKPLGEHLLERCVGERCGGTDSRQLAVVLDRAQLLDQPVGRDELDSVRQQTGEPLVLLDRHLRGIEAQPSLRQLARPRARAGRRRCSGAHSSSSSSADCVR